MGKIHDKLSGQKGIITDIYCKYPVAICAFGLVCIIAIVNNCQRNNDIRVPELMEDLYMIFSLTGLGSLLAESYILTKKKEVCRKLHITGCVMAAFLAVIWDIVAHIVEDIENDQFSDTLYRIFAAYIIFVSFMAVYYIIKNTGLSLQEYGRTAIFNLIKMGFTFGVINIGALMIIFMFETLITEIDTWNLISNFELLITATVYIPYVLICITDKNSSDSKLKKMFLRVALMIMVVSATTIIYLYFIKVVFGGRTSNEIFSICAWFFAIGAPIWEMANYDVSKYEGINPDSIWNKIIVNMPYIFAPFILLEIYSMGSRIAQYGVTPTRYAGVILIVFQIVYVGYKWVGRLIFKSEKKENLILVGMALLVIAFACPFLNYSYSSYASQKSRLNSTYPRVKQLVEQAENVFDSNGKQELSDKDWETVDKFMGAYEYLRYDSRGEIYISEKYGKKAISELAVILRSAYDYHEENKHGTYQEKWVYMEYKSKNQDIDISGGYTKLYKLSMSNNYTEEKDIEYFKNIEVCYGEDETVEVDITGILEMLAQEKEDDEYFYENDRKPYVIDISSSERIVITELTVNKRENSQNYGYLNIQGYLLKR